MEQKRKRSVLITVVSIIAISVAGSMIFWSICATLMGRVVISAVSHRSGFQGGNDSAFGNFPLGFGVAGIAFLIAAIGMLKRKNCFIDGAVKA